MEFKTLNNKTIYSFFAIYSGAKWNTRFEKLILKLSNELSCFKLSYNYPQRTQFPSLNNYDYQLFKYIKEQKVPFGTLPLFNISKN